MFSKKYRKLGFCRLLRLVLAGVIDETTRIEEAPKSWTTS